MLEQFNKEAGQGWRFAADAARITDGNASSEDRKHTSGGVFVAVDSNLGAVIGKEEGAVESIPGNGRRIAQALVNDRVFFVYVWHFEGWTPRYEALLQAVVKQARTTRHPWLIGFDANMRPEDFETSLWFRSKHTSIKAPADEVSTCRSRGPKVSWRGGLG